MTMDKKETLRERVAWEIAETDAHNARALSTAVAGRSGPKALSLKERADRIHALYAAEADALRAEVERLRKLRELEREAVALLDRVEISMHRDTFDGAIAGGPPVDVDLFAPGPKYGEWEAAVRRNRLARHALNPGGKK